MSIVVRPTAVMIERGRILLIRQNVGERRRWSLPGGKLEMGESLCDCLIREMREETGLDVEPGRLLYVGERIIDSLHVVHLTFEVIRKVESQVVKKPANPASEETGLKWVVLTELSKYGFSETFQSLAIRNFPDAGSYVGAVENIGL